MTDRMTALTKRMYSRRRLLAFSAAGVATAALAACGGSAVPTTTPAATVTSSGAATPAAAGSVAAGPAATATAVPQTFGAGATTAPGASAAPSTSGSAAAGAASPSAAAQAMKPANLADKQVFRYPEAVFPDGLDPNIITSPYVTPSMFEGVINVNTGDGTFESAMAESYSSNMDATVWTFKIRPGLKWSDGMPLTAKDFEYSWRRVMDPATKSKYTSALYAIKNAQAIEKGMMPPDQLGVKAVDDRTFEVTLNEPIPFFPLIASTWTCLPVPKQAIDKLGDKWVNGPNVVSNGPFVL